MPFWTYMLHCNAGRFYTGHTDDLERRVADHKAGRFDGFTKNWQPVELVWSQEFVTRDEAKSAERRIKGWSRAKKLALIRGDWEAISRLAKSKGSPSTGSGQTEVEIAAQALEVIRTNAQSTHPHEVCGILLGEGAQINAVIPTSNIHPDPETHFEIDPQALIDAYRQEREGGPVIMGYYHSHPNGDARPSATDRAMAAGDGKLWAIVAGSTVTLWRDEREAFAALSYRVIDR